MIPKEVKEALYKVECSVESSQRITEQFKIINNFIKITDKYVKDLEQHVDDLVAGQHGMDDD